MIIGLHVFGIFFVLIAAIKKIFTIDLTKLHNTSFYLLVLIVFFSVSVFSLKYFSNSKIEKVVLKFDEKNIFKKKQWDILQLFP